MITMPMLTKRDLTLIESLLDRKLDEKLDQKLGPFKKEIYQALNENTEELIEYIDVRFDAFEERFGDHEERISKLENKAFI
jgi:hypothetical protein